MISNSAPLQTELLLIGGGHTNIQVLKSFTMRPITGMRISLISDVINAPYSAMLPGFIASEYRFDEMHIDLVRLANFANARFINSTINSIDSENQLVHFNDRPSLSYDLLSVNTGITPDFTSIKGAQKYAVAVKPISHFLKCLPKLDGAIKSSSDSIAIIGSGAAGIELAFAFRERYNKKNIKPKISIIGNSDRFFPELSRSCHLTILKQFKKVDIDVYLGQAASQINKNSVILKSGLHLSASHTFIATGAKPAEWLKSSTISLSSDGYIEVNNSYQSISDKRVFAAGDISKIKHQPLPRSGVFAVRAGPVLAKNLRLALDKLPAKPHRQQSTHLSLVMLGSGLVMAKWGRLHIFAKWLWPLKKWIDQEFISEFKQFPNMTDSQYRPIRLSEKDLIDEQDPLLDKMYCAGCGAKAGSHIIDAVLPDSTAIALKFGGDATYLPTLNTFRDTSEYPIEEFSKNSQTIVQTVDSISQMISDPFLFGRIAALHALSDMFVGNAVPLTALSLIGVQRSKRTLQKSDLINMLAGAMIEFSKARVKLIGGHTSQSNENSLGFALTGFKNNPIKSTPYQQLNAGEIVPHSLILTKPLGIGLLLAAAMQNHAPEQSYEDCIKFMLESNIKTADFLWQNGAIAMTDVTGFGLVRHVENIVRDLVISFNMKIGAEIFLNKIPLIKGASHILENTAIRASLHQSNKRSSVNFNGLNKLSNPVSDILFDPQTSGGIVAVIPTAKATKITKQLKGSGAPHSSIIGALKFNHTGIIIIE